MMKPVPWSTLKLFIDERTLSVQWFEDPENYYIAAIDGNFGLDCILSKSRNVDEVYDFETNYKSTGNLRLNQYDSDGATIVRTKAAKKGWTYCACAFEFSTSVLDSIIALNFDASPKPWITMKCFDADGVQVTDIALQNTVVMTQVDFEPPYDYEVVGGEMRVESSLDTDLRMFIIAVPDVPYVAGGSRVMCENLNLKFLYPGNMFQVDGRVSKFLSYNPTYHTNKLRFVFWHDAGVTEKLMITIEHYKQ